MKQKLTLLKSQMLISKNRFDGWMFGILWGLMGAMKSQIGVLYCDTKKDNSTKATTLWNSNAEADLISIFCDTVKQWWWVAALVAGGCWAVCVWIGSDKAAERFKKGVFAIVILFFVSLWEPQIRASVEAIGQAIAG